MLGGDGFLPVHWGTFSLAMHAWDGPDPSVCMGSSNRLPVRGTMRKWPPAQWPRVRFATTPAVLRIAVSGRCAAGSAMISAAGNAASRMHSLAGVASWDLHTSRCLWVLCLRFGGVV